MVASELVRHWMDYGSIFVELDSTTMGDSRVARMGVRHAVEGIPRGEMRCRPYFCVEKRHERES